MGAELARAALRATVLPLVASLAMLAAPLEARAWCQMTSDRRAPAPGECILANPPTTVPLAWRRPCSTVALSVAESRDMTEEAVRRVLRASFDTWEQVDCGGNRRPGFSVSILEGASDQCTAATYFTDGPNSNTLTFVADGWEQREKHPAGAYALTLAWYDPATGEIWDVDMEVNEALGPYAECPEGGCPDGSVDLRNMLTHEVGHYFGVGHSPDDPEATMWASAPAGELSKRDLSADDVDAICAIYPPGALEDECDANPRGGLGLECRARGQCDCAVPFGRTSGAGAGVGLTALLALLFVRRRSARR